MATFIKCNDEFFNLRYIKAISHNGTSPVVTVVNTDQSSNPKWSAYNYDQDHNCDKVFKMYTRMATIVADLSQSTKKENK